MHTERCRDHCLQRSIIHSRIFIDIIRTARLILRHAEKLHDDVITCNWRVPHNWITWFHCTMYEVLRQFAKQYGIYEKIWSRVLGFALLARKTNASDSYQLVARYDVGHRNYHTRARTRGCSSTKMSPILSPILEGISHTGKTVHVYWKGPVARVILWAMPTTCVGAWGIMLFVFVQRSLMKTIN